MPALVGRRFADVIVVTEIVVFTTKLVLMTEKIFYNYGQYLATNLLPDHSPKILFLYGHASCWSKEALLCLVANKV
jgi:hypothetical protein